VSETTKAAEAVREAAERARLLEAARRDEGSLARLRDDSRGRIVTIEKVFYGRQVTSDVLRAKVIDSDNGAVRYVCYCELEPF
jgi:hypothetical protein